MTETPTPVTSVPMNQDVPPSSLSMTNFSQQITEKLNHKNFLLWKQQTEPAITAMGLSSFIASPQIPPR